LYLANLRKLITGAFRYFYIKGNRIYIPSVVLDKNPYNFPFI